MLAFGSFGQLTVEDTITSNELSDTLDRSTLDSTINEKGSENAKEPFIQQLRIGIDVSKFLVNSLFPSKQAYGFQVDYALRNEIYLNGETGFGRGKVDYSFLNYNTDAFFIKFGIDKSFLDRLSIEDFDMGFLGVRYGIAAGKRGEADFIVTSPLGTQFPGQSESQSFLIHWVEVTGGIKVEVWNRIFLGWSFSGKFMLNPNVFEELSPHFIPGYGKGDKNSTFDFNFYLSYALRWHSR